MTELPVIGLDWGTSSLRAYLLGPDGVRARRESPHGLRALPPGGFAAAFAEVVANWPAEAPVLMAGMVGARTGWREAPYVEIAGPGAGLDAFAARLEDVSDLAGRRAWIVPGAADPAGPDVMRGEETQLIGAAAEPGGGDGVVVLPGSHSKWATLRDGRIAGFRTAMTGEVFAALSRATILADTLEAASDPLEDEAGFDQGVAAARALAAPGELLSALFSIRARVLFGDLPARRAGGYLSGLLIGAEVAANLPGAAAQPVRIVAAPGLAASYARALDALGAPNRILPPDMAAAGLASLAAAARLAGAPA